MKQKGWINRQIAQMEREAKTWPDWMRRSDMQKEKPILFSRHLNAILDAEAKATPGPWFEQYEYDGGRTVCQMRSTDTLMCVNRAVHVVGETYEKSKENAALIALSRNHIRELCEEVLRLREENDRLRNTLSPFAMIGNPRDYAKRPNQIDVPFEWCEAAFCALEHGKEGGVECADSK